jgi:hypothetical protein
MCSICERRLRFRCPYEQGKHSHEQAYTECLGSERSSVRENKPYRFLRTVGGEERWARQYSIPQAFGVVDVRGEDKAASGGSKRS